MITLPRKELTMAQGDSTIATLETYIARAEAKIEKWQARIEEVRMRQAANPSLTFAMKGFKSRFSLLSDTELVDRAWKDYTLDCKHLSRDAIIKAMLQAEFGAELASANGAS